MERIIIINFNSYNIFRSGLFYLRKYRERGKIGIHLKNIKKFFNNGWWLIIYPLGLLLLMLWLWLGSVIFPEPQCGDPGVICDYWPPDGWQPPGHDSFYIIKNLVLSGLSFLLPPIYK